MEFPGFAGNAPVKHQINQALETGRFPHAVLIQGAGGLGKRTLARLLAKALVCRDPAKAPCGLCPSCIRAAAGSHPDIRIEEGSGATRSLSVDTIRAVTADAFRMPEEADVSIFLLFIQNRISEAAQNKLLKLLEEPPGHAMFIITCRAVNELLPTIRSRVQVLSLQPVTADEAAQVLQAHDMTAEDARRLAAQYGGNIGRALQAAAEGQAGQAGEKALAVAGCLMSGSEHALLAETAALIGDKDLLREVLRRLELIFRDALVQRMGAGNAASGQVLPDRLHGLPAKRLLALVQVPGTYTARLDRNINPALLITCLCSDLRTAAGR